MMTPERTSNRPRYFTTLLCAIVAGVALTSVTQGRPVTARIASGLLGRAQFLVSRCDASTDILSDVNVWVAKRGADVSLPMVDGAKASEDRLFNTATDKAAWCADTAGRVRDVLAN